jgi:hypothetical protein
MTLLLRASILLTISEELKTLSYLSFKFSDFSPKLIYRLSSLQRPESSERFR